ncbi:hypothetical protein IL252_08895 [Halomicrobium sp. IBSBa]|nr:hypothetical protein [Halomicrobium sp. IBSBa]
MRIHFVAVVETVPVSVGNCRICAEIVDFDAVVETVPVGVDDRRVRTDRGFLAVWEAITVRISDEWICVLLEFRCRGDSVTVERDDVRREHQSGTTHRKSDDEEHGG